MNILEYFQQEDVRRKQKELESLSKIIDFHHLDFVWAKCTFPTIFLTQDYITQ